MKNSLISLQKVSRSYGSPPVRAIDEVSLTVENGEFVAIVGPSGSGKSTLLNLIGTLDTPNSGIAQIAGQNVNELDDKDLSALRAYEIGFVFQQFHLSEGISALGNVADGLIYTGLELNKRLKHAKTALEKVGLAHRLSHKPNQLSGGERQRVAIARAVVGNPPLLLADEPTGNLDSASGAAIIQLLHELNLQGTTIVVITHDTDLAKLLPRQVRICDGKVIFDSKETP